MSGLQPTKQGWSRKERGPSSTAQHKQTLIADNSCVTMCSQLLQPCGRLVKFVTSKARAEVFWQQVPGVHVISALPLPEKMIALFLLQAVLHCQGNGVAKHDLQQRSHRQAGQPGVVQAKPGCQVVQIFMGARSAGHRGMFQGHTLQHLSTIPACASCTQ